jgi:VCBS repeat-containing protein
MDAGEPNELQTLAQLNITELNYSMGTFTQNGMIKQLASPDLVADAQGSRTTFVPEGILVQTSQGETSLIVTQVDDRSNLAANQDGVTSYEDIKTDILADSLLANDSLGGISGSNPLAQSYLRISSFSSIDGQTHGSLTQDANGNFHFKPDPNYFGEAQFNYTLEAVVGGVVTATATATVVLNVQNVNDAPVVTIDQHTRPIYGYDAITKTKYLGDGEWTTYTVPGLGTPRLSPYTGFDALTGTTGVHNTAVAQLDIDGPNVGTLVVTDPDGPNTGFKYEVTLQSQHGKAIVDANGNFSYENWVGPNTAGTAPDGEKYVGRDSYVDTYSTQPDPFTITVTDTAASYDADGKLKAGSTPGASTSIRVDALHTGAYYPDLGSGGGKKPISIDLGNDGFGFTNVVDSSIFFDINSDGFKHRTSWPKAGDGLLTYDVNGNGIIDNGSEISFAQYLNGAQTDLEGLAAFDTNKDGIFSALDDKWSKFGVWQDSNQNGITDAGELRTLDDMGIASIGLASDGQFAVVDGQTVHGVGVITKADGSTLNMADVTVSYSDQVQLTNPDGTTTVVTKPEFAPSGEVINGTADKDLMLGNNGNTILNGLEGDDVIVSSIGNDVIDGGAGNDLLYGAEGNDLIGGGVGDDVIFGGLGNDFIGGGDGHDAIMGEQGNDIIFGGAGNDFVSTGDGNDVVAAGLGDDQVLGEGGNDALFGEEGNDQLAGMDGYDRLNGGAGDDVLDGGAQDDTLFGGDGNDTLIGGAGADTMEGGIGNDTYEVDSTSDIVIEAADAGIDSVQSSVSYALSDNVENLTLTGAEAINATGNTLDNVITGNSAANVLDGGAGADTLIGGQGNDTLMGGAGNDRYVFNLGDGADTIVDASGSDTLFIGSNLTEANLEGFRVGDDMLINVLGTTDAITLTNWFVPGQGVNRIEFADGSFLDPVGIEGLLNRPPVANPDAVTVFEDGGVVNIPTSTLLANDTDPNTSDIITVTAVGTSAVGASVTLVNGQVQYDIGNSFQELAAGQTITDAFSYTISDRKGATDSSVVNVTITGVNDAPVTAADDAAALQEDTIVIASGNVLANDTDIDQGTVLQVANAGTYQGNFGSLLLNADGSYTYALDNSSLAVQSLSQGQVVTETFAYQATDGFVSTPSTLTVTITGTNDAPVVVADTASVQEDLNIIATGNVLTNDFDVDQGTVLTVENAGVFAGQYGQLTLAADGSYTYVLDNASLAVQSLAEGQVVTESFAYAAFDGITSTPSTLTVSITGTNDAPVTTVDTAAVQEDLSIIATGNVLANDTDVDQGTVLTVANAGVFAGQYGQLTLATDGGYTYALDNAAYGVQSLAAGQTVTETFAYQATDGLVATPSTLTVTITGTNDAPVVAAAIVDQSTLEDALFSFTVPADTFTDIDQGDVLTYQATLPDGTALPGWLSFDAATRTFSGIPSNWDVGVINVSVTATDKLGLTATDTFTLDVQNVNDAPVVANHLADQHIEEDKRFSIVVPANTFDDWDIVHGDSLSYSATLANGDKLPKWLTFDAVTRTFSGKAEGSKSYDILLTATDESGASVSQVFTLSTGNDHQPDDGHDHHVVRDTTQDEIISSSTVNDIIHTGNGTDTIVFQRGDGQDTVYGGIGTDNTLVLDGIKQTDLALSKNGNDLILETGNNEQITLRNWYDTSANYKSVLTLDIIASAVAEFDGQSGCGSNHHDSETKIDQFDFTAVVNAFDQACASSATYQHWSATQSLSVAHIDDGEDSVLGSTAFKDVNISSLLAAGQGNQTTFQLNTNQL